ncbi:MAG TPA: ATP-binding protein [Nitrospira sp.]|nr:ATP-binding protein [Nitrospira sp.]HNK13991.1 ATP-binding protein [Nitrospira sp.]HNL88516.1 ATP-binding protein [Nitrospira sp.]HUM39316.1 ATP-binding protein [Nitrospira sp.]
MVWCINNPVPKSPVMAFSHLTMFEVLKASTLVLLAALLFSLGSASHHTSLGAYLSFSAIMILQALELFAPALAPASSNIGRQTFLLRISIFLQMVLAGLLVGATDGSGSIYELVYLLPIVSAATKLSAWDVVWVVGGSIVAMMGFIVTGEQLSPSITRVKEFQDAVAAMVYFTMAGLLVYVFAKGGREQSERYRQLAETLIQRNSELKRAQSQLMERLDQVTKMEERLQQVSQMAALGEMAGQIAHEVRNPLGIIRGAVDMLATRVKDPGTHRHIAVVLEETTRLNKAVEGVLRLGAPLRLRQETVDLSELLEGLVQTTRAWTLPSGTTLGMSAKGDNVTVRGDRDLLHQAMANIVRNAFQAMPSGGLVTITQALSEDGSRVSLTVTDQGIGLASEDLQRLGEPFFTKRGGGIGLGFSLARRVVKEHGGTVHVSSTLGQGTSVTMELPVCEPTPAAA